MSRLSVKNIKRAKNGNDVKNFFHKKGFWTIDVEYKKYTSLNEIGGVRNG